MLGERPTASTRKRREYRAGHIARTSRMREKASILPITLVENLTNRRDGLLDNVDLGRQSFHFSDASKPMEDEERYDTCVSFTEPFEGPALASFNTKMGPTTLGLDKASEYCLEDAVGRDIRCGRSMIQSSHILNQRTSSLRWLIEK